MSARDDCSEAQVSCSAPLRLAATHRPREYRARFIRAGRIRQADNSPGPFEVSAEALADALDRGLFVGIPTFVDHAGAWDAPSLKNLAGQTVAAGWDDEAQQPAVAGTIRLYDTAAGQVVQTLFDQVLEVQAAGQPAPDIGLSLVFWPKWRPREDPDDPLVLASFRHVESLDFVFQPAADGRIREALARLNAQPTERTQPMETPEPHVTADAAPPAADPADAATAARTPAPAAHAAAVAGAWAEAMRQTAVNAMLAGSGLPAATQEHLRRQNYATPEELQAAIQEQQQHIADLRSALVIDVGGTPPRGSGISVGRTGLEQVQAALDALVAGTHPPSGVRPLTGIRELYNILSGDYEMHGIFQPDRVMLANVNSSTMAGLVANALNKAVINAFQVYPRWWEPLCTIVDFGNLQDARWITLGGIGELPTVAEGAAYTELTWDDNTETSSFVKKGGYLGITIEAIDKDDTGKITAAPRALAQAAWLTLSKSVSDIFTTASGTGPVMSDGVRLFHSSHGNLGSVALTWANYVDAREAMMKQTELNSGERLGILTAPYYILVPIDQEVTALQILGSIGEPGTADNDTNPLSEGDAHDLALANARGRVITVPLWTDTNDWALAADPRLYPSIGLGFRYGRTPEIFSVASPTAGLMFTNDTMPVKVRFFYAVGPTDYRGLRKHNVTGS